VNTRSGTPLERAEGGVHEAQAVLGKIDQVLHTVEAAQAIPGGRALMRAGFIMIAGGIAFVGVAVVRSRLRH
jgi:hypothetical protein